MTDFIRQLGLGFLLEFTDKTSAEVGKARAQIKGMKGDVEGLTESYATQISAMEKKVENSKRLVGTSLKVGAAGAAIMVPMALAFRESAHDQSLWARELGMTFIAQGQGLQQAQAGIAAVDEQVARLGTTIVALDMDDLQKSYAMLYKRLGADIAMPALEKVGKLGETTGESAQIAANAIVVLKQSFGASMPGLTDLEKVTKIADYLANMKATSGLGLEDISDGMRLVMKNAGLMNMTLEKTASFVIPLLQMGMPGRMAGSSVNMFLQSIVGYQDKVKELTKKKGQAITWGDILGLNPAAEEIPVDSRALLKIKVADVKGRMRDPLAILREAEKAVGFTEARRLKLDQLIKSGDLSLDDAMAQVGVSLSQQKYLQQLFGESVGLLLGKSGIIDSLEKAGIKTGTLDKQFELIGTTADHSLRLAKNGVIELAKEMGNNLLPIVTDGLKAFNSVAKAAGDFAKEHPAFMKTATVGVAGAGAAGVIGGAILAPAAQIAQYFQLQKLLKLQQAALGLEGVTTAATSGAVALGILTKAAMGLGIAMTTVALLEDMKAEGLSVGHTGFPFKMPKGESGKDKFYEMMYGSDFSGWLSSKEKTETPLTKPSSEEHLLLKGLGLPGQENLSLYENRYDNGFGSMFGGEKNGWGRQSAISNIPEGAIASEIADAIRSTESAKQNWRPESTPTDQATKDMLQNLKADTLALPSLFARPKTYDETRMDVFRNVRQEPAAQSAATGTQSPIVEPSGIAQTVYQSNTFYIDAKNLDVDTLKRGLDKTTRGEAERGVEGKR